MNQLVQMQTTEQMGQLNETATENARNQALAQGASLIGRQVQATTTDGNMQGIVESVRVNGGEVSLDLGTTIVRLADVQIVKEAPVLQVVEEVPSVV